MKFGILSAAVLALAACAKQPDAVAPVKFDHKPYLSMSCKALATKQLEGTQAVASLSAQQQKAANNDAFGVFLLGLPLASMSGNDPETQLAVAKGQLDAIELARAEKGCS